MLDIFNQSGLDLGPLEELIQEFMPFAQERHGFQHPPKLFLLGDEENAANPLGKTGGYNPDNMEVTIYVSGRHPKDILRSLSHELVHHNQNERGDFSDMVSTALGYAQEDPHMRDMEGEAYREGNLCFRDWEDGRKKQLQESIYYETVITEDGGEDMSKKTPLKEWKDNEINSRLMEKFGLTREAKSGESDSITFVEDTTYEKQINEDEDDDDGGEDDDEEDDSSDESESTNESLTTLHNDIAQLLQEELTEQELAAKYAHMPAGATWTVHEPDYAGLSPDEMKETEGWYKPWFVQDESEWKPPGLYSLSAKQQREDPVHREPPSARDKYTDLLHQRQLGSQHATEAGLPWYHWKQFVPTMQQDPANLGYHESSPLYFGQYDDWRGDIPIDITPYTAIDALGIGAGLKGVGRGLSKLFKPKWQKLADEAVEAAVPKGTGTIDDAYQLGLTSKEARSMGIQLTDEMAQGLDDAARASRTLDQAADLVPTETALADELAAGLGRPTLKNIAKGTKEMAGAGKDFLLGRTGGTFESFPSVFKGQLLWLPLAGYGAHKALSTAADKPGGLAEYFYPEKGPMETEEEWADRAEALEYLKDAGMEDVVEWRPDVDLWEMSGKDDAEFERLKNMQDKAIRGELGNILVISGPEDWYFYQQDLERLGLKPPEEEETPKRDDFHMAPTLWEELYEASEPTNDYYNTLFEGIKHVWSKEAEE